MKMQVIEGKHLQSGGRSKRGCIWAAESIFKAEAEAEEDASAQPKASSKWRQKQKRMHLRSRRHLQSGDRSKKRYIYVAESIFKAPKEAQEDASGQLHSISKGQQKQKKMHLRS